MTDKPVSRNAHIITTWAQKDSNDPRSWKDACVVIGTAGEALARMIEIDREFREKHSAAPPLAWCVTQTDLHMPGKEEDDLYEAIIEQMRDGLRKCQLPRWHMRYTTKSGLLLHCENDEQRTAIYKMLSKPRGAGVSQGKSHESDIEAEIDVGYKADSAHGRFLAKQAEKMGVAIRNFLRIATQHNLPNQMPTTVRIAMLELQKSLEFY